MCISSSALLNEEFLLEESSKGGLQTTVKSLMGII